MTTPRVPRETALDGAAVLVAGAMIFGTYLLVFYLLEGSWFGLMRHLLTPLVALLVYSGLTGGIVAYRQRHGATARRWWFLLLLPACGATAGAAAATFDGAAGGVPASIGNGICWGILHALYLRWWWRRDARTPDTSAH